MRHSIQPLSGSCLNIAELLTVVARIEGRAVKFDLLVRLLRLRIDNLPSDHYQFSIQFCVGIMCATVKELTSNVSPRCLISQFA